MNHLKAIILAAGMGTRLRPLTNNKPKALVEVNGGPIIERQLRYLHEKGIKDITVVTGYLHEKFFYLTKKYGVKLVHNDKYSVYNNLYSMYLVKDLLPDSYVIEGDVFIQNNVFETNVETSTYFSAFRPSFKDEWRIVTDKNNRVVDIDIGDGENDYILSGISYWSREDGEYITKKIEDAVLSDNFTNLFWDDIVRAHLNHLQVYLHKLKKTDCIEIDTLDDYRKVEQTVRNLIYN